MLPTGVKEIPTKKGKKMFITERDGKVYASYSLQVIESFLKGEEVDAREGRDNWVFINRPEKNSSPNTTPTETAPCVSTQTTPVSVVTDGERSIMKAKLVQIVGELNELIRTLG